MTFSLGAGDGYDTFGPPTGWIEFYPGAPTGRYRIGGGYSKRVEARVTCPEDNSYTRPYYPFPIWLDSGGNRLSGAKPGGE